MSNQPTDKQRQVIKNRGDIQERKRKHYLREMINAVAYNTKAGCQPQMLPKEFAP